MLATDNNPANDFKRQTVYMGDGPAFAQYYNSSGEIIEGLGSSILVNGYNIKLILLYTSYGGKPAAEVEVSKSGYTETAICLLGELSFFDNGNLVLNTIEVLVSAQWYIFDVYIPSNVMNVLPQKIFVDAGFSGIYNFSTTFSKKPTITARFTDDATIVNGWLSVENFSGGAFELKATVPLAASRRLYNFWARTNSGYIQYLEIKVNEPHNVQAINLLPENNSSFALGETLEITGVFKNNGGYNEPNTLIRLDIHGPNEYHFSDFKYLDLSIGQQGNSTFYWNTTGSPPGQYSIKVEAILDNDPYNNNSITNNIFLESAPASLTVYPTNLEFANVEIFDCSIKTYQIISFNLTNDLIINSPLGFMVSINPNNGFSDEIIISSINGSVNTTIYVQFCPIAEQLYTGNVINSSTGAIAAIVSVSGYGTGSATPEMVVFPESIFFGNVSTGDCSIEAYQITGQGLFDNIIITAPLGFQVSTQPEAGFDYSIIVPPVNGTVNQTIYVKFCPVFGQEYSGDIVNESPGAPTSNVEVFGVGFEPEPPEIMCIDYFYVCINSEPFNLTSASLCWVNSSHPEDGHYSGQGVYFYGSSYFFDPSIGLGQYIISYCFTDPLSGLNGCDEFLMEVLPLPEVTCPGSFEVSINEPPFQLSGGWPEGGEYLINGINEGTNPTFSPATAGIGEHLIQYFYPYYEYSVIPVIPPNPKPCINMCEFLITVFPDGFELDITIALEGAFYQGNGNLMHTALRDENHLPLSQPFAPVLPYLGNSKPVWFYQGTETVESMPEGTVDWVLLELRDAENALKASKSKVVAKRAALLLSNGQLVGTHGLRPSFDLEIKNDLFVVVYHRNHLAVMSSGALPFNGNVYSWDFTQALEKAFSSPLKAAYQDGHKHLGAGIYGMYGGDADGNGQIQTQDKNNVWNLQSGQSGYLAGDFDLNGQVQTQDKNEIWNPNSGMASQVPDESSGGNEGQPCPGMPNFSDPRDGIVYNTVQIGDQCWLRENLKYLPAVSPASSGSSSSPHYYVYGYQGSNLSEAISVNNSQGYGVLYNWPAAMNACPTGWHLPAESEWLNLTGYLINNYDDITSSNVGNKLKSCRQIDSPLLGNCATSEHPRWVASETHYGSDQFGFSALPGGNRSNTGAFEYLGAFGNYWTSDERSTPSAYYFYFFGYGGSVQRNYENKSNGFSVRCVRDE